MNLLRFISRSLIVAALGVSATVAFAFEGRITMQMSEPKAKEPLVMNYIIKSPRMKIEFSPQKQAKKGKSSEPVSGGIIVNQQTLEAFILMEMGEGDQANKMYMRRDLKQDAERIAGKQSEQPEPPKKTGRSETIAGYKAEEYVMTNKKGEVTEMWLSKELGAFHFASGGNPMAGGRGQNVSPEWEKFAKEEGAFPLRVVSRNKKGDETSRLEVTKVEKTSIPDKVFSLDGYQEFNLGSMMQGMFGR